MVNVTSFQEFQEYRYQANKSITIALKKKKIYIQTFMCYIPYSVSEIDVFITYFTVNANAATPIKTIRLVRHDCKLLGSAVV